ncbi:MAG: ABC transporter ATP-binding protein [Alphaproteobacteria bacterium]|nr:ABC transporter ATP-binding protein [Alphaproteobacteria bacterium]
MASVISVQSLSKTYRGGFKALDEVNLEVEEGEILALLGPNGAGKTTLISIVCGTVSPTSGSVTVAGHDIISGYRHTRSTIGLVAQELALDIFETVWNTVKFSRGLFGKAPDDAVLERVLKDLSLWDRRESKIMALSGGMKRRVEIAKALVHEPRVLFLDEPTAGVDVELRKDMWDLVRRLRDGGVTIILTTHYIEEAEEMADRIGVIDRGKLILIEEKTELLRKLGKKQLFLQLNAPLDTLPASVGREGLALSEDGRTLVFDYDTKAEHTGITRLLADVREAGIAFSDLETRQSSLEDIFVGLVGDNR